MAEYPEVLEDLGGMLGDALVRHGLKKDAASEIAWEAVEGVRRSWGGQQVYIPRGEEWARATRDQEIYALFQFEKWPYLALARKYDLTEMRVRQIIHRVKSQRCQRIEPRGGLFPVEDLA